MLCGILGVGIAAPLFLPGVMHILLGDNQNGLYLYINNFLATSTSALFTLKAMFFPAELQGDCSAIEVGNYASTACYLPMVGITFVIAYVRKHRDWLTRLLLILFVMSFSPLLSSSFLLFTGNYHRWWGAFVMMLALATILALDKVEDYKILSSAVINGLMIIAMWVIVKFVPWDAGYSPLVFKENLFNLYTLIAMSGVILCVIGAARWKWNDRYMICCVSAFAIMTTGLTIYEYQNGSENGSEYMEQFTAAIELGVCDEQYRYLSEGNIWVFPGESTGTGAFSSTRSNAIKRFDENFDSHTDITSLNKTIIEGLPELVGGRYYLTDTMEDKTLLQQLEVNGITYYVYERPACPIGYVVSDFITEEKLKEIPVENRGIALLAAVVVAEEDVDSVSDLLVEATAENIDFKKDIGTYVADNSEGAVDNFDRDANGFTCTTSYAEESFVYFTVPYDNDWTLYIDGEKSEIISSGGMLLARVPAGEHSLVFEYGTPFYGAGVAICMISLSLLGVYEFLLYRSCKNEKNGKISA